MKKFILALILGAFAVFGLGGSALASTTHASKVVRKQSSPPCQGYSDAPYFQTVNSLIYMQATFLCDPGVADQAVVNMYLYDSDHGAYLRVPTFSFYMPITHITGNNYDSGHQQWTSPCPDGRYIGWAARIDFQIHYKGTGWGPLTSAWSGIRHFACTA